MKFITLILFLLVTPALLAGKNEELIKAAVKGDLTAVETLLRSGADIHSDDDAALFIAIRNKNVPLARLLLKWNANILARDDKALELAIDLECEPMIRLIMGAIHIRTSVQDLTSEDSSSSPTVEALTLASSPIPFFNK